MRNLILIISFFFYFEKSYGQIDFFSEISSYSLINLAKENVRVDTIYIRPISFNTDSNIINPLKGSYLNISSKEHNINQTSILITISPLLSNSKGRLVVDASFWYYDCFDGDCSVMEKGFCNLEWSYDCESKSYKISKSFFEYYER